MISICIRTDVILYSSGIKLIAQALWLTSLISWLAIQVSDVVLSATFNRATSSCELCGCLTVTSFLSWGQQLPPPRSLRPIFTDKTSPAEPYLHGVSVNPVIIKSPNIRSNDSHLIFSVPKPVQLPSMRSPNQTKSGPGFRGRWWSRSRGHVSGTAK